jgi:hypothetical protein
MVSPVNASRQPSRTAAHHSGPERLARPYSAVDLHLLSFASLSWRSLLLAKPGHYDHGESAISHSTRFDFLSETTCSAVHVGYQIPVILLRPGASSVTCTTFRLEL